MTDDAHQHSPAAERNAGPILDLLRRLLPRTGTVLEIASGTGQHAIHFGAALPRLTWLPSDADPAARASIRAWIDSAGLDNVLPPIELDVRRHPWPVARVDAIYTANLLHVAASDILNHLMQGTAHVLDGRGNLLIYGPFRVDGQHTATSNARFDEILRRQNPSWGIRDISEVGNAAERAGLQLRECLTLPANNLMLVLAR